MIYRGVAGAGAAELIGRFGEFGTGPGQLTYPTDVAVVSSADGRGIERLYVSEYGGNDRISIYEPVGAFDAARPEFAFVSSFGRFGSGDSGEPVEFNRPQAIEWDSAAGELIVADACNHRIGRFRGDGALIGWIGGPERAGEGAGQMRYPYGLEVLSDRTVLASEFGNGRVQRFDLESGRSVGIYGRPGRGEGELTNPWAVTVVGRTAWVLDSGNNRVVGFRVDASAAGGGDGNGWAAKGGRP